MPLKATTMISTAPPPPPPPPPPPLMSGPPIPRSSCRMLKHLSTSIIPSTTCRMIITTPHNKLTTLACFYHQHNKRSTMNNNKLGVVGRDRVIDFGKYKGKMLGSLPSSYLKWVSKNLRAGDSEEWARLADEVLSDPIYRDRLEWELAEKVLNGDRIHDPGSRCSEGGAVSELLEISSRFGWDNEDKIGWSRIDFGLLGTSKGGRIPRLLKTTDDNVVVVGTMKNVDAMEEAEISEEERGKRKERRERMRRRRRRQGGSTSTSGSSGKKIMDNDEIGRRGGGGGEKNPLTFPGREALLNKMLLRNRNNTIL